MLYNNVCMTFVPFTTQAICLSAKSLCLATNAMVQDMGKIRLATDHALTTNGDKSKSVQVFIVCLTLAPSSDQLE